jgi:hypothetical protein
MHTGLRLSIFILLYISHFYCSAAESDREQNITMLIGASNLLARIQHVEGVTTYDIIVDAASDLSKPCWPTADLALQHARRLWPDTIKQEHTSIKQFFKNGLLARPD